VLQDRFPLEVPARLLAHLAWQASTAQVQACPLSVVIARLVLFHPDLPLLFRVHLVRSDFSMNAMVKNHASLARQASTAHLKDLSAPVETVHQDHFPGAMPQLQPARPAPRANTVAPRDCLRHLAIVPLQRIHRGLPKMRHAFRVLQVLLMQFRAPLRALLAIQGFRQRRAVCHAKHSSILASLSR